MSGQNGKVYKLEAVRPEAREEDVNEEQTQAQPVADLADTNKDMSKVAMIVSLLAVVLLVIFFFGMNRNIAGLTDEVKSLGALREDVSVLDQKVVSMEQEMPSQMKRMLAHDVVNEMTMKASYLGNHLEDEALKQKMLQVSEILKSVRTDLEK
ncbi:hypothetical protein [Pseudodesulfovibrio tunisiensis]|uniref:hypothetical protein n=1 Tax=Pseudodesulfovibrio tunisiensis TaxID=463192 RepID=UPI001FB4F938|nr:hypothetical protein [Pseudodesulfovibrio tunisiensis]